MSFVFCLSLYFVLVCYTSTWVTIIVCWCIKQSFSDCCSINTYLQRDWMDLLNFLIRWILTVVQIESIHQIYFSISYLYTLYLILSLFALERFNNFLFSFNWFDTRCIRLITALAFRRLRFFQFIFFFFLDLDVCAEVLLQFLKLMYSIVFF